VTISGTAEAGASVELFDDATSKGTASADATGAWSKAVTAVEGSHTYTAKATDAAGNTSAASSAVTVIVDTTAPQTTIDSGPSGATQQTSASLSFSSPDAGATFECRLDGGAWAPCTSPKTYTGLVEGSHTFEVRAVDAAGNTDSSPASRTWTVDTTAPQTVITSAPPAATATTSASFNFTTLEAGSTLECSLDGGAWAACTSPKSYSSLAEGSHTFEVRATDAAGNTDATPASHSWTVDLTPPETTITASPPATTTETIATFEFSSSQPGSTFQCSLDGEAFSPCANPMTYVGLSPGAHTFEVRATDPAGNADASPATHNWTIT
jgi:hypothetical protein